MKKIKIPFLDLKLQHEKLTKEINQEIQICIENSAFIRSKSIIDFEKNFSNLTERNYCVSRDNGTDALFMAMKSLNHLGPTYHGLQMYVYPPQHVQME